MARIKNTHVPNLFGNGYEKEITLDNGEKYIIKNTHVPNLFGNGYEQKIIKKNNNVNEHINGLEFCLCYIFGMLGIIFLCGLLFFSKTLIISSIIISVLTIVLIVLSWKKRNILIICLSIISLILTIIFSCLIIN